MKIQKLSLAFLFLPLVAAQRPRRELRAKGVLNRPIHVPKEPIPVPESLDWNKRIIGEMIWAITDKIHIWGWRKLPKGTWTRAMPLVIDTLHPSSGQTELSSP